MIRYFFLICVCHFSIHSVALASDMGSLYRPRFLYLQFSGADPSHPATAVLEKLKSLFIQPLDGGTAFATRSWNLQVYGPKNAYEFNLIFEPLNEDSVLAFDHYVKSLESKLILGSEVHFQPVQQLNEKIHLEIGHYDQELPDPFVIRLDYPRPFTWLSLGEWLNFSNNYGFILMNKDHLQFQKYVLDFIKTSDNFDKITHLLKTNPVMALRSEISVLLESGQLISPGPLQSPFLEFRFFRNCFQSEYENGACFQ